MDTTLQSAYQVGIQLASNISQKIEGIIASTAEYKHGRIAQAVFLGGDKSHLEIGTLYGGTAILAAMVKQHFGLDGQIVCVDPFIDEDIDPSIKALTEYKVSPMRVHRNAGKLGVADRIIVRQGTSEAFFRDLDLSKMAGYFGSAYIDGDHTYEGIAYDYPKVAAVTSGVIIVDDFDDPRFPGVTKFINELKPRVDDMRIERQLATIFGPGGGK